MMVSMAFLGHINVMVFTGAASGVVRIQTSGSIWVGKFVSHNFCICNEHFELISTVLFAYRTAIQDCGFAKGLERCSYAAELTICFSTDLKLGSGEFYCHGCILGDA